MYTTKIPNLDLTQTAKSGQCFRWKKLAENKYNVIAYDHAVNITQNATDFTLDCDESEWNEIWKPYLDLETDYGAIGTIINSSDDEHLKQAFAFGSGIRILRQDLWEMIVTYLISQNNNIKRITASVDMLCRKYGSRISSHEDAFAFPTYEQVPLEALEDKTLGLGYRTPYLIYMFEYTRQNPEWLDKLYKMSYDEAMENLMIHKGIGKKVANCICLFGLHHVEAFPIDTHVKQLLDKYYADGFDFERYDGIAGIVQQYLFYWELNH